MNRIWKYSLLTAAIIIADQLTKGAVQSNFYLGESIPVIDGFFNFTFVGWIPLFDNPFNVRDRSWN